MSIQDEITRINNAKNNIINSIENKGVNIPELTSIDGISTYIDEISGSSNIEIPLSIEKGGTGATTLVEAKTNLGIDEKLDKNNPIINGNVNFFSAPTKIVSKTYDGNEFTILMAGVNATDNLWIGSNGYAIPLTTHKGSTIISAGLGGKIRVMIPDPEGVENGVIYDIVHKGMIGKKIWGGQNESTGTWSQWSSGSITIPELSNYTLIGVYINEIIDPILCFVAGSGVVGISGTYSSSANIQQKIREFHASRSGNKLTWVKCNAITHRNNSNHSDSENLVVNTIIGVI